jgi:hypothetical protein
LITQTLSLILDSTVLHYQLNDALVLTSALNSSIAMIAPNEVGDADLASTSIPQRRKPRKLRHKRPIQHGLDEAVEKEPNVDTLSAKNQTLISRTSEGESSFEDALEEEPPAFEPQVQPVPQQRRQTPRNRPFRDEEQERDVADDEDVSLGAERQRLRRGQRGDQTLIRSNTIEDVGRTVGQSGGLVRRRTETTVGTITDTSGRVHRRPSEENESLKKEGDEHLSLRLDLNLDLEVQLKAKISGDLTLTLLLVSAPARNGFGYSLLTEWNDIGSNGNGLGFMSGKSLTASQPMRSHERKSKKQPQRGECELGKTSRIIEAQ